MDKILRCITADGGVMAAAMDSTYLVATMRQIHKTSPVATAALGRLLTAASIMGSMLKGRDASLTLKIKGGGPMGMLVAVSDSGGNVRGYAEHPDVTLPLRADGKLDVGRAVGSNGILGVIRDFGSGTPYIGQVALRSGEIAEDIAGYYTESEQIPTVCALGVLVDKQDAGRLLAGGMLIQVLPGADDDAVARLERNALALPPVTAMLAEGMTMEDMCRAALKGFTVEVLDSFAAGYACPCSRERVAGAIASLSPKEIRSLAGENGFAEASCQFCNRSYQISALELEKIAAGKKEKK